MDTYTARQTVELFHLCFLDLFGRKIDKSCYALKGGCNLRFFFNSIRYSEDMDFDLQTIAQETLRNKVNRLLASAVFIQTLRRHEIVIDSIHEHKQTATTQRWKVMVKSPQSAKPLSTKLEFSRRNRVTQVEFGRINAQLMQVYQLTPMLVNHYTREAAYSQKIAALIGRKEPQARYVFDLYLLITQGVDVHSLAASLKQQNKLAQINALSISFADFVAQVVAYLEPEYQAQYHSQPLWDDIVLTVTENIGGKK